MKSMFTAPSRQELEREMFIFYSDNYCDGKELTDKQKQCAVTVAMLLEINFIGPYAGKELPPTATPLARLLDEMLVKAKESEGKP